MNHDIWDIVASHADAFTLHSLRACSSEIRVLVERHLDAAVHAEVCSALRDVNAVMPQAVDVVVTGRMAIRTLRTSIALEPEITGVLASKSTIGVGMFDADAVQAIVSGCAFLAIRRFLHISLEPVRRRLAGSAVIIVNDVRVEVEAVTYSGAHVLVHGLLTMDRTMCMHKWVCQEDLNLAARLTWQHILLA